jgi:non-ribosomal peptide synthetase component F
VNLAALLGELQHRSVLLDPQGHDLRCRAPQGALTPELREAIVKNKAAILSLLGGESNGRPLAGASPGASRNLCVHRLFEAQAERTPLAIAAALGGEELTYGELERRSRWLARHLSQMGVRPEVRVGIRMEPTLEVLVALLGVLRAGGVSVLADPGSNEELPPVSLWLTPSSVDSTEGGDLDRIDGAHLAVALASAGTAGEPHWVEIEHGTLADVLTGLVWEVGLREGDILFGDALWSSERGLLQVLLALVSGARIASSPDEATVFLLTPSLLRRRLLARRNGSETPRLLSTGEPMDRATAKRLKEGGALWNLYGCVEGAMVSATGSFAEGEATSALRAPAPERELYVLDSDLEPVPAGVVGEIYLGGASLARGYWCLPSLTAARFLPSSFSNRPGARVFSTEDRGRRGHQGSLEFVTRSDRWVPVRGARADMSLVEAAVREHPRVLDG